MGSRESKVPIEDWQPGRVTLAAWMVLSVPLLGAGGVLFGAAHAAGHGGEIRFTVEQTSEIFLIFLTLLGLILGLIVLHEYIHGLTMRLFGAEPIYGAGFFKKTIPYAYCSAPGHRFSKGQFMLVGIAPAVTISLFGALWVAFGPYGGWLVLPLALHLTGCIGDFWMVSLAAAQGAVL